MAKTKNEAAEETADDNARLVTTSEDITKANKWFLRARELGEKRQFDYAIEYYVNGLEFWPEAVEEACKPYHGCAVARRQTGGKKAGLKDTLKRSLNDKDAKKAYINALWLFGKDPENISYLEGILKNANRLHADDAAFWSAGVFLKALENTPKASVKQFHSLAKYTEEVSDRAAGRKEASFAVDILQIAVEAMTICRRRFPKDDSLDKIVKNISTKLTIIKGKYADGESFRDSIRDADKQHDLHDEQRSIQDSDRVDQLIAKAQRDYEENPTPIAMQKVIDMLCKRERDEDESKAINLLMAEFKKSDQYRWKSLADDIRMKQLTRKRRVLEKGGDADALKQHRIAQLRFELNLFKERIDRYPTDNRLKFEYGVRNFMGGRFDEAIPLFQTARSDPKNRSACGLYLGRCFYRKGYHDQAIPTLEETINGYEIPDDELGKSMRYWLARTQEAAGKNDDARKTYGAILQLDYNYADVRPRLDKLPA